MNAYLNIIAVCKKCKKKSSIEIAKSCMDRKLPVNYLKSYRP